MDVNLIGVMAGTIALLGSCSGGATGPPEAVDLTEPITSRAVAAQTLTHLPGKDWPAARGLDDVSESGDEEVHLATWSLGDATDFVAAVAREREPDETDAFDGTCAGARQEGVLTCRELTVDGQPVIVFSSSEDLTGGIYKDGITWAAASQRPNGDQVMASLMIGEIGDEEGLRKGQDLPVSLDILAEIAADPLLALETTPQVIANGAELEGFQGQD